MNIIIKPIISEKMSKIGEKIGRYGFVVNQDANKLQIKAAIEKTYGVSVADVNTINMPGKVRSRYTRAGMQVGVANRCKKAIVTLKKGETIDFYSNL
ncbi:MAG: 50S ribosomal protein L23 [Bacteroidia bacterium]